jgi:HEPN domain-containing protein
MSELPDNNYDEARRWLGEVEGDLRGLDAVLREPEAPRRIVCFLAHLAVEKALKATLIDADVPFKKTHDLVELHTMCSEAERLEDLDRGKLTRLNPWTIDGRYADDVQDATSELAVEFSEFARAAVDAVRDEFQRDEGEA